MNIISSKNIVNVIKRTLNYVDKRLINHGERVSYIVYKMLMFENIYDVDFLIKGTITALIHDIGAYKTEEIDKMVKFETEGILSHSIYGYLFLKNISPLNNFAEAVLYHHKSYYNGSKTPLRIKLGGIINVADFIDLIVFKKCLKLDINKFKNSKMNFNYYYIDLFLKADKKYSILENIKNGNYKNELNLLMEKANFTEKEKKQFLRMISYSIDFRSEYMVLHTVTTVCLSVEIGNLLNLDNSEIEKLYYGALFHDIGKISTPVNILEKPEKLTDEEFKIMKKHVSVTGEIFKGLINSDIYKIAVRHHEKLDGSGYPLGLKGKQISQNERIVAIADIISALARERSYKKAMGKTKVIEILTDLKQNNKICPLITEKVISNYDMLITAAIEDGRTVCEMYDNITNEFNKISSKYFKTDYKV